MEGNNEETPNLDSFGWQYLTLKFNNLCAVIVIKLTIVAIFQTFHSFYLLFFRV